MNKPSIARRLFLTFFTVNILLVTIMSALVITVTKRVEQDFLQQDFIEERNFILSDRSPNQALHHRTQSIIVEFIPNKMVATKPFFSVFNGLEHAQNLLIERQGQRYLINIQPHQDGRFFHARNVSQLVARESRFLKIILAISLVIIGISFVLAYSGSRRIVAPLYKLARHIGGADASSNLQSIGVQFNDRELHDIATVFNQFLTELKRSVDRERSLVEMASHELRTPVAVVLGAVEVMKSKQSLSPANLKTLNRIENAASEMSANIDVLLKLSRRDGGHDSSQKVELTKVVEAVIDDLSASFPSQERVELVRESPCVVEGDAVLIKMLLRNLTQNALQHTDGLVCVRLNHQTFQVIDHGRVEQNTHFALLAPHSPDFNQLTHSGLGLYIVTLICDRLNWTLEVIGNQFGGSTVTVACKPKADT